MATRWPFFLDAPATRAARRGLDFASSRDGRTCSRMRRQRSSFVSSLRPPRHHSRARAALTMLRHTLARAWRAGGRAASGRAARFAPPPGAPRVRRPRSPPAAPSRGPPPDPAGGVCPAAPAPLLARPRSPRAGPSTRAFAPPPPPPAAASSAPEPPPRLPSPPTPPRRRNTCAISTAPPPGGRLPVRGGEVAATESNLAEYLKALVRVDRLNESALLRTQKGAGARRPKVGRGSGGFGARGSRLPARAPARWRPRRVELGTAASPVYAARADV